MSMTVAAITIEAMLSLNAKTGWRDAGSCPQ